jgi:hypothetical protein
MAVQNEIMHEAEAYLRNPKNPTRLCVQIGGKRRRLFINRDEGRIGILAIGKRKRGYIFTDWQSIEKVFYPVQTNEEELNRKLVLKYQRLAKSASFSNDWLADIAKADPAKSLYENHITTGTRIDGKCIRLSTVEKYAGVYLMADFKVAVRKCEDFHSYRFDFCGYDGSLWVNRKDNGKVAAGFSKEYRGYGNGYYYLLINDDTFIGYDVD